VAFAAGKSELTPQETMTSFAYFNEYHSFVVHAEQMTSQTRLRIEYLIPSDNIIVPD